MSSMVHAPICTAWVMAWLTACCCTRKMSAILAVADPCPVGYKRWKVWSNGLNLELACVAMVCGSPILVFGNGMGDRFSDEQVEEGVELDVDSETLLPQAEYRRWRSMLLD